MLPTFLCMIIVSGSLAVTLDKEPDLIGTMHLICVRVRERSKLAGYPSYQKLPDIQLCKNIAETLYYIIHILGLKGVFSQNFRVKNTTFTLFNISCVPARVQITGALFCRTVRFFQCQGRSSRLLVYVV